MPKAIPIPKLKLTTADDLLVNATHVLLLFFYYTYQT